MLPKEAIGTKMAIQLNMRSYPHIPYITYFFEEILIAFHKVYTLQVLCMSSYETYFS